MDGRRAITCILFFIVVVVPYSQTKLTEYLHGLHSISLSQYLSNHILDTTYRRPIYSDGMDPPLDHRSLQIHMI
jgi:hypothetical protein